MSELAKERKGAARKKTPSRRKSGTSARKNAGKAASSGKAAESPVARRKRMSAEVRQQAIAEAAYYKAEHRGFANGNPQCDWLEAEAEIDATLLGAKLRE